MQAMADPPFNQSPAFQWVTVIGNMIFQFAFPIALLYVLGRPKAATVVE